jgi:RHS repeat-associated protein
MTPIIPGQPAFTRVLDRSQDTLLRESGWELKNGATTENSVRYDYSLTDGRLSSISNPQLSNVSFAYGYETGSSLVKTVTGPAHTVTNTYEQNRNTLDVKENKAGTSVVSRYDYTVNAIGQRSNVAQTGTAFASSRDIAWGYDSLGQVTRADSTIPGLDRAYAFDMIGNRLRAATGSIDPNDPAAATYTPNALNQYSQITNNSITNNSAFDADGNMTAGPLPANVNANSTLVWDGENRLIQATVGTTGSVVRYSYDSQSRRIAETVGTTTKLTIYDGWNPIAEYWRAGLQPASLAKSFTWGIDLSGTLQGAGGVGGLLMTSLITNNSITSNYFPTYDGNGNVSEYLNESGEVSAHYEYDPFGKTTVATGPKANDFAHRFSTKPLDPTTGLYYYGRRFYDPNTGRWPSRDPIAEEGGVNLYGFVGNDPIWHIDVLGLIKKECPFNVTAGHSGDPDEDGNVDSRKKEFDKNKDNCNSGRFYGASCGRTGVGSNLAWPTPEAKQMSLDGTMPNKYNPETGKYDLPNPWNGAADPNDLTIGQLIKRQIQQAEADAQKECEDKEKCCARIILKVTCLSDLDNPLSGSMATARKHDPLAKKGCNFSNVYECPNSKGKGGGWKGPKFDQ